MAACGEWFWPRGYLAETREIRGVLSADLILSVHPKLSLLRIAEKIGKSTAVCGNGWDAGLESSEARTPLPKSILDQIDPKRPLWLYVGRGDDPVKGADRVRLLLRESPHLQLIAVPGTGFESENEILRTGRLDSSQVRSLMELADGLIVTSRYEGNSLVVLEALALGLSVITTPVGSASIFPKTILGLEILDFSVRDWVRTIELVGENRGNSIERTRRWKTNRKLLPRWKNVAEIALAAVIQLKKENAQ